MLKISANYFDKEKYKIYYENLQPYSRLELKLKKIHRVLEFKKEQKQRKWEQRWKSVVQINEQCCIQKNNGKLKK